MSRTLTMVTLSDEQIRKVREKHGDHRRFTHALVCEGYGAFFGTEQQCEKYFKAWRTLYADLFDKIERSRDYTLTSYQQNNNLGAKLAVDANRLKDDKPLKYVKGAKKAAKVEAKAKNSKPRKGFWAKLFG